MSIYTKTGDKGHTSLLSGQRVPKYSRRVETYGTLDELNSWFGYIRSVVGDSAVDAALKNVQTRIHRLCSDVALPYKSGGEDSNALRIQDGEEVWLEKEIDDMTAQLPELKHFIHPGGSAAGAALHITRTVCRRAERRLIELNESEGEVNPHAIRFVNRLSDYLFTLARYVNHKSKTPEEQWRGE